MVKKSISVLLILLLLMTNIAGVLATEQEKDPKGDIFETNIDKWTFAGDGNFGEKKDYYGKDGKFMSHQTVQYAYAISELEVKGDKSFKFEVEFDVPNYDTAGAEKGWCWQSILFGVQDAAEPGADNKAQIDFKHFPEGQETINVSSAISNFNENVPMKEEKISDLSHKVLIYYSIIDNSVTITIDGEEMFKLLDAEDDVKGKLGFGATWSCMRVLKAVYTELTDETPAPVTPTPEVTVTNTPKKTDTPEASVIPITTKDININTPMVIMIVLGALVVIAFVIVIIVAVKRKK